MLEDLPDIRIRAGASIFSTEDDDDGAPQASTHLPAVQLGGQICFEFSFSSTKKTWMASCLYAKFIVVQTNVERSCHLKWCDRQVRVVFFTVMLTHFTSPTGDTTVVYAASLIQAFRPTMAERIY